MMQWLLILYISINFLAAVVCSAISFLVQQRTAQVDWGFRLFALMTALWCATSGLFFLNQSIYDFWIWTGIQLLTYVSVPILWFYFILQFTNKRIPSPALLFVVPIATLIVYWNPNWSVLMWDISQKDWLYGLSIAQYERGPWFTFIHLPYTYGIILLGNAYLVSTIWQSQKKQKRGVLMLLLCGLIPLLFNVFTLSPFYESFVFFDLTPIGLAISTILFCWGLSHYQILQRSPFAYQQIFASLKDSVFVLDLDDRLVEFNSSAEQLFGLKNNRVGESVESTIPFLKKSDWHALEKGDRLEAEFNQIYFQIEKSPIMRLDRCLGYILSLTDITQAHQLQEQILKGALLYDSLTGLPNRTLFSDRLRQAIKYYNRNPETSIAVAFIDVDRFKIINDSLGHAAGDELLFQIAQRLQDCLRSEDTIARLGGDEFAILVINTCLHDIKSLCKRLQNSLQEPISLGTHSVKTSASIGIAFGTPQMSLEQLLQNADIAMYQAKSNGKGTFVVFEESLANTTIQRMELEVALRQALEKEEFFLVFQPIVSIHSGTIQGFEALLRWQHPMHGLISPAVFIPIAEEMGIISALDHWVLKHSCQQLYQWQTKHPQFTNLKISVNLSTANFMFADLDQIVADILETTKISGQDLKLEITESILMKDPDETAKILEQLKMQGVDILLDDFGTGHSSLSYLHRLPLAGLKIDQSFVQDAQHSQQSLAIMTTIIALAQRLKLQLVAEGIETEAQRKMLRNLGCELGQGYLWWRPLTYHEANEALQQAAMDLGEESRVIR
jgi:diguanylate cyclase (GGDEF)-like protein/PAS domain S-box-containing protein